ncbi:hypothetical protein GALMADRAFT_145576 [Galerina marginata CBS 339.88]|uniref:THH1/TOM1/TOM3 domain-containing protein n=1 Tax=Galerina marginata (strain CBS 339.88) TaxID=685588 RepID=A0A067SE34_GALM3|nr:hypothetical protein GALMADRAFT_145576 [Galerina marginata CBS 339.88]
MSLPQTREAVQVTAGFIESVISTSLNSTMLVTFLMGIYTIVYFGSLGQRIPTRSYRWCITMLYLLCVGWFAIQWYIIKWQFVVNGSTRATVFAAIFDGPTWNMLVLDITTFLMYIIADGLLIWRCFYVWDRSFRIIAVPLFLLLSETALYLTTTVFEEIVMKKIPLTVQDVVTTNSLLFAGYFVSFATSLMATLLIAYRVYSVSKQGTGSAQRFRRIIEIMVQTAAVYSLALLGIAPTLMVARVALAAGATGHAPTTLHLSQLEFGGRSATHADTLNGMDNVLEINEEKRGPQSEKDQP